MVLTQLIGGLGNQMFQYAAGRALADYHKVPLKLDLSWFEENSGDKCRTFRLENLNIEAKASRYKDLRLFERTALADTIKRFFGVPLFRPHTKYLIYNEPHFYFDRDFYDAPPNTFLRGYWQSEKYFESVEDIVRKEFVVSSPLSGRNKQLAGEIDSTVSVGIHIRRGDYVENEKTSQFHGVLTKEYYLCCIESICTQLDEPHFFVFSNDLVWAQENLKTDSPTTFVTHNGPHEDYEDLRLLSLCKHQIIANSSFSWWAAWLNNNSGKIVMAPRKWFADENMNNQTEDLIPQGWLRI